MGLLSNEKFDLLLNAENDIGTATLIGQITIPYVRCTNQEVENLRQILGTTGSRTQLATLVPDNNLLAWNGIGLTVDTILNLSSVQSTAFGSVQTTTLRWLSGLMPNLVISDIIFNMFSGSYHAFIKLNEDTYWHSAGAITNGSLYLSDFYGSQIYQNGINVNDPLSNYFISYASTASSQLAIPFSNEDGTEFSNLTLICGEDYNYLSTNAGVPIFTNSVLGRILYEGRDEPVPQPDDPFSPGGTSEPGGGGGTFDDSSDSVPDSSLPTLSAANTGFTRIYNPTLEQVQAMANYLWTDETVLETIWNHIKQFLENPMEAFIGFNLVPCEVPDGGTQEFKVMYIGTGVNMTVAANQFVDVDCGTVTVEPYYGSALDYAPYTRISCFLPYIGQVDLDTDEVMGTTLQIKYRIDIVTGSCVAKIFVDGNVVYQYSGHCAINIPFTSADFSNYVSAIISIAKLAVGAAAAGAAGAIAAGPHGEHLKQLTGQVVEKYTERNPETGRQITVGTFTRDRYSIRSGTEASFNALSPSNIANTVGQVMSSKPAIEHAGSFSGNSGYLGVRRPFLDITRPRMCNPSEYGKYNGYPAMLTLQLGNCTGFTQVQQIQLTGLTATNPEQAEILSLLKTGVIL